MGITSSKPITEQWQIERFVNTTLYPSLEKELLKKFQDIFPKIQAQQLFLSDALKSNLKLTLIKSKSICNLMKPEYDESSSNVLPNFIKDFSQSIINSYRENNSKHPDSSVIYTNNKAGQKCVQIIPSNGFGGMRTLQCNESIFSKNAIITHGIRIM